MRGVHFLLYQEFLRFVIEQCALVVFPFLNVEAFEFFCRTSSVGFEFVALIQNNRLADQPNQARLEEKIYAGGESCPAERCISPLWT